MYGNDIQSTYTNSVPVKVSSNNLNVRSNAVNIRNKDSKLDTRYFNKTQKQPCVMGVCLFNAVCVNRNQSSIIKSSICYQILIYFIFQLCI